MTEPTADESADLVNPKDFVSIRLAIQLANLTGRSEPLHGDSVLLSEIRDKILVLELPQNSCMVEHNVMIKIARCDVNMQAEALLFQATGKVVAVQHLRDERIRAMIDLIQFDEASRQAFMAVFTSRQDEITRFLAEVKG